MNVAEFTKQLKKRGVGPGAAWRKADLHIHLPGSSDYEYRGHDASTMLGKAITDEDLAFAVILKHESFPTRDELAALGRLCPRTKLIPGVEINVIVDALFKKIGKDYFFHCVVAVDPDQGGEFEYVLRKAQEQFSYRNGPYPAGFTSSIVDVGHFFRENGALFIPAHLHQSRTPDTSRT